jgi:hypothetical protein
VGSQTAVRVLASDRNRADPVVERTERLDHRSQRTSIAKMEIQVRDRPGRAIQPKGTLAHFILFECVALRTSDVSVQLFTKPASLRTHPHPYWQISFRLFGDEKNTRWSLKPSSTKRGKLCPASGLLELRQRLVEELRPGRFALTADSMLSPSCLCCGKALTDPVSQARWIGPECWGSASTNLPRIFKATQAEGEAA